MRFVGMIGARACRLLNQALVYATILAAIGAFWAGDYLAAAAFVVAALATGFLMRVMCTWWPTAVYALHRRLVVEILQTRMAAIPDGEDGRLAWIRTVAGNAGFLADFEPGPDGAPNEVLVLREAEGGIIGVRPR
jgi:hypothetical protein